MLTLPNDRLITAEILPACLPEDGVGRIIGALAHALPAIGARLAAGRISAVIRRSLGRVSMAGIPWLGGGPARRRRAGMPPVYAVWYLASTASMARTLPADLPSGSKEDDRKASAMSLASSTPTTRAPMVMMWALFEVAALPAE